MRVRDKENLFIGAGSEVPGVDHRRCCSAELNALR